MALDFGTPEQRDLVTVTQSQIRAYHAEGHFPPGSTGANIEAAIRFLEGGGERLIIAHLNEALPALKGEMGTSIVSDGG